MQILADYHTHTKYSHGKGTIEENVLEAISKGIKLYPAPTKLLRNME